MRHSIPVPTSPQNRAARVLLATAIFILASTTWAAGITVVADSRNARGGAFLNPYWQQGAQTPTLTATDFTFAPGTNGILIVTANGEGNVTATSATYNGTAMTQIQGTSNGATYAYIYYVVAPAAPTTGIVV